MAFGFIGKLFGNQEMHQAVIIAGEVNKKRLESDSIIIPGYLADPNKKNARRLIRTLSIPFPNMGDVLIFTQRNTMPYNPFVTIPEDDLKKLLKTDKLAKESFLRAKIEAINESRNNLIGIALIITACVTVVSILLMFGITGLHNGTFHI